MGKRFVRISIGVWRAASISSTFTWKNLFFADLDRPLARP